MAKKRRRTGFYNVGGFPGTDEYLITTNQLLITDKHFTEKAYTLLKLFKCFVCCIEGFYVVGFLRN